jgi:hypothetical protein
LQQRLVEEFFCETFLLTRSRPHRSFDCFQQLGDTERLRNVSVHASTQTMLAVTRHRMRGHGNHRLVRTTGVPFLFPYGRNGLQPIHFRHLNVHQHDVECLALQRGERLPAIAYQCTGVPLLLQHASRQLLIYGVVFGQQNVKFASHPAGSATGDGGRRGQVWFPVPQRALSIAAANSSCATGFVR